MRPHGPPQIRTSLPMAQLTRIAVEPAAEGEGREVVELAFSSSAFAGDTKWATSCKMFPAFLSGPQALPPTDAARACCLSDCGDAHGDVERTAAVPKALQWGTLVYIRTSFQSEEDTH